MPGPWIDLTRPMDPDLPIYAEGAYRDPPYRATPWCRIEDQGYAVWRLELGTQTGTHIDAPAHFVAGGATLDALRPDDLTGRYLYVDAAVGDVPRHRGEPLLLLDASWVPGITAATFEALLALPCRVWIIAGSATVEGREPLHLHRALARAGRFLVEDLDPAAVPRVPARGEAVALPLRLAGLGGSPARVLVRSLP